MAYPNSIFIDNNQNIYIADFGNDRIVKWKCNATQGQIVAGGNRRGNQLNGPTDVFIDQETNSLIIADHGNKRVMRCSRPNSTNEEITISNIYCSRLTINKNGDLYVSESRKNEVRRWKKGEKNGTIVADGNGQGQQSNQFNRPSSLFFDREGNLYVTDRYNHRIQKFEID